MSSMFQTDNNYQYRNQLLCLEYTRLLRYFYNQNYIVKAQP